MKQLTVDGMQVFWTHDGQRYCTNRSGEGAWLINENGIRGNQVLGTTQLCLRGVTVPTMRKRIQRFF